MTQTKTKKISSDKLTLIVKTRQIFGKKLKKLRKENQVPGNIFGQNFKSQAVTVDFKEFIKVYRVAKETGVIYLHQDKNEIPVLIQHLQKHPVSDIILHVDFRKVDLSKKIETDVPVKIVGSSEAISQKGGVLLTQANTLRVEARPEDIPSQIEVDISALKEIDQEIKIVNLSKKVNYTIIDPLEKVVVSVVAHKEETIVPETTTAAPEIITEKEAPVEEGAPGEPESETKETKPEKPKTTPKEEKK